MHLEHRCIVSEPKIEPISEGELKVISQIGTYCDESETNEILISFIEKWANQNGGGVGFKIQKVSKDEFNMVTYRVIYEHTKH